MRRVRALMIAAIFGAAQVDLHAAPASIARPETGADGGAEEGTNSNLAVALPSSSPVGALAAGDSVVVAEPGVDGLAVVYAVAGKEPRVMARLRVEGVESDLWTGEVCRTGSGRLAAASFAPVEVLDDARVRDRGAFGAVVDLESGEVSVVGERVALKHNGLGCGPGDEMVFVRHNGDEGESTELLWVDRRASVRRRVALAAHVGDPAPVGGRVFVSAGSTVYDVAASSGRPRRSFSVSGVAFDLHARADGSVDLLEADQAAGRSRALRAGDSGVELVAEAPLGSLAWGEGRGGANRLVVPPGTRVGTGVESIVADPVPAAVSLGGSVVIDSAEVASDGSESVSLRVRGAGADRTATVTAVAEATAGESGAPVAMASGNYTTPKCAVPRNDPSVQVMQPSVEQIEWAVNQAVRGDLTITRPADWNNNGLAAYSPQGVFPRVGLTGGGRLPAQVVLGLLAQESNLKQAAKGALSGVAANPLIADYYGIVYDEDGRIVGMDFDDADCGYGLAQITTGMTAASSYYTADQKKMIATDYAANIAAAVRMLEELWNRAAAQGLVANDGSPSLVENWYFVLWAYNTGLYDDSGSGPYGVGWTNNPANTDWKPDRRPFLRQSYEDAEQPYFWPYQEKVMGWAETGQFRGGELAFEPAGPLSLPVTVDEFGTEYVAVFQFCSTEVNDCDPDHEPGWTPSYEWSLDNTIDDLWHCTRSDRKCWWHGPNGWGTSQGWEVPQFVGDPEPTAANPHPPSCSASASQIPEGEAVAGMLDNAIVVDDLDFSENIVGCDPVPSMGTFDLSFGTAGDGAPLAEIDFHQIGAGYGGHFWYAHTNDPARTSHEVVGTWTPAGSTLGWTRVVVHIPDHGADTYQAKYRVWNGTKWYERTVNQRWNANTWVDLGMFELGNGSKVELSNSTANDYTMDREIDIAWDAMAFVATTKPEIAMVALGDSYSAGEGVEPYYTNSDVGRDTPDYKNTCHRSSQAYPLEVYQELHEEFGGSSTFHFAACSSARIRDINDGGYRSGEVPQADQGWLDENTTHVAISIGGNDARFAYILQGCMLSLTDCLDPDFHLTTDQGVDPEPLIDYEPQVIEGLSDDLDGLLGDLQDLAPNAKVVLVGYPHVVYNPAVWGDPPYGGACALLDQETVTWFDEMDDLLNEVMVQAAADNDAYFVDPRERFGSHEACAPEDEWINAVVAWSDSGSGYDVPGAGSFHPKAVGHAAYADAVLEAVPGPPPTK